MTNKQILALARTTLTAAQHIDCSVALGTSRVVIDNRSASVHGPTKSEIRAARARCAKLIAAIAEPEVLIACRRCLVGPGICCTAMTHTGYKAIRRSHPERLAAWVTP